MGPRKSLKGLWKSLKGLMQVTQETSEVTRGTPTSQTMYFGSPLGHFDKSAFKKNHRNTVSRNKTAAFGYFCADLFRCGLHSDVKAFADWVEGWH
ncbi:MAG: hypothetical protein KAY96_00875 [Bacteroidia bacterium]|nr:hypothetical protein [Bacteroidia bacterium]